MILSNDCTISWLISDEKTNNFFVRNMYFSWDLKKKFQWDNMKLQGIIKHTHTENKHFLKLVLRKQAINQLLLSLNSLTNFAIIN